MTIPLSKQSWNDEKNPVTSPMISPRYTSHQKRQLTSDLRQALPPLLLSDESSSSILSSSSLLSPRERRKRTISSRKQLSIADEPLRRMIQEQTQQRISQQGQQQQRSGTTCSEQRKCEGANDLSPIDTPFSLQLYAPWLDERKSDR